jgi:hypothetical protein
VSVLKLSSTGGMVQGAIIAVMIFCVLDNRTDQRKIILSRLYFFAISNTKRRNPNELMTYCVAGCCEIQCGGCDLMVSAGKFE